MERIEKEIQGFEPLLGFRDEALTNGPVIMEDNDESQTESPYKRKNFSELISAMYENVLANVELKDMKGEKDILERNNSMNDQFYDYGKGIRTKMLINNILNDPYYEEEKEEVDEDEEFHDLLGSSSLIMGADEDDKNSKLFHHSNINSVIKTVLNTKFKHSSITVFKAISFLWIIVMLSLSIFQNQVFTSKLQEYEEIGKILDATNARVIETSSAVNSVIDIMLLQKLSFDYSVESTILRILISRI